MTEQRTVHPTGIHHEPTKSHTVDQKDEHDKKWSEEASMVGSDVREGLGKYQDVRPATGATGLEQTRGTGAVHETGHTDSSVYKPRDMTDTATKEGSDQREGLGTAAKSDATVDKGHVEKEHKHKHKHEHHHKHDTNVYPVTSHATTTTTYDTQPTTYAGSGYPGSTTSYEKTDTSGTPSTHYGTHTGTHTGMGGYTDTTHKGDYYETSKLGSDKREGLGSGTGAAYGTSGSTFGGTTGDKTSGWTDTANKTGSDIREDLGSGTRTHTTQGAGQYQ
jgi:hypothetical protein